MFVRLSVGTASSRCDRPSSPGRAAYRLPPSPLWDHSRGVWCNAARMGTKGSRRLFAFGFCLSIAAGTANCGSSPDPETGLRTAQAAVLRAEGQRYIGQYQANSRGAPSVVETYLQDPPTTYVTRYFVAATHYLAVTETHDGHTTLCLADQRSSQCLPGATVSPATSGPLSPRTVLDELRQADGRITNRGIASATFAGQAATCFSFTVPPTSGVAVSKVAPDDPRVCVTTGGVPAELGLSQGAGLTLRRLDTQVTAAAIKRVTTLSSSSPATG
jgi:hypothetical protein